MKAGVTLHAHDKNGREMTVSGTGRTACGFALRPLYRLQTGDSASEKGSIRLKGYMSLPCDIIIAMSPYGKEIGSQWLDDTRNHAGIPMEATSGLQKFEAPDPAYWCNHGYAIINPDVRGSYNSEGIILFFGSDYGRDGADIIEWAAKQAWSNGKIGMSGNSWLAISQWFTAAQHPEHLAAIAPWEGRSIAAVKLPPVAA